MLLTNAHFGETNPLTDPIAAPSAIAAMSGLSDVVTTQPGRVGEGALVPSRSCNESVAGRQMAEVEGR